LSDENAASSVRPSGLPVVFVDADACPVKPEILKVAGRHEIEVVLVSNGGLRPTRDPRVRNVIVSDGFDAADDWIADNAVSGDIAVTADVPLAVRLVEKGVVVLDPKGRPLGKDNIGMASAMRNLNQDLREAGVISGFNAPFTQRDRSAFLQAMDNAVRRAINARGA
jgi:uncharacterized protein YaiI (UPF0178 family)